MPETSYYPLVGGLDLVTPPIAMPAGRAITAQNYHPESRGYQRLPGYERYDGRPKPSDASYWVLDFDAGSAAIAEGDTVTGATSGATGKALIDAVVESGSYVGTDAAGYLVLTNVSGTFVDDESLQVSAVTKSTADGTADEEGAENDANHSTWLADALATARALIAVVPGSGRVRGVWSLGGTRYAFRDNAGATAAVLHRATASGWTAVDLGRQVDFTSGGTFDLADGDEIEGATSGATATVERVIVQTGSFSAGDAAGFLILSGQVGTFQAENLDVGANLNVATIAGDSAAITPLPGGEYEFETYNFGGNTGTNRMYGVDGVNRGFEFDGTVYVPIRTGMTTDTPVHLACHKKHLFLFFAGGSAQHSGIGDPYSWSVVTGAAEIALGEDVTGAVPEYATTLVIIGRNKVAVLYGSDAATWDLDFLASDSGGIARTVQKIGQPLYLDDIGVRGLNTTQAFGDFKIGTITQLVEPLIAAKRKGGFTATGSMRVRSKDQYRLFWSDKSCLVIYFGRKKPESLPLLLDHVVRSPVAVEETAGEAFLFCGDDGFVYEMDVGVSFDGEDIDAYLLLPFNNVGSPTTDKRWHKATFEIDGTVANEIGVVAEFSYGDSDQPPGSQVDVSVTGGGGFWNVDSWNEFFWSTPVQGRAEIPIDGIGTNIALAVLSTAADEEPHTLHGVTLHHSPRRLRR